MNKFFLPSDDEIYGPAPGFIEPALTKMGQMRSQLSLQLLGRCARMQFGQFPVLARVVLGETSQETLSTKRCWR